MKGAGKSVLMFTDGAAEILDSDSDAEDRADLLNDSQSDGSLLFVLRVSLFHDLLFECVLDVFLFDCVPMRVCQSDGCYCCLLVCACRCACERE